MRGTASIKHAAQTPIYETPPYGRGKADSRAGLVLLTARAIDCLLALLTLSRMGGPVGIFLQASFPRLAKRCGWRGRIAPWSRAGPRMEFQGRQGLRLPCSPISGSEACLDV